MMNDNSNQGVFFNIHRGIATAFLCALLIQPLFAKETTTEEIALSEDIFLRELPVVLGVTRLSQPKSETPAAVTVIDRELIHASGAREIADLFRLVPGFQVAYRRGNRAHFTYHGLNDQSSQRMQVMIDGRSVYSPLFGGLFLAEQSLVIDNIERIEIVRGPNAAAYGTNSVFGIINIVTRDPTQVNGSYGKLTTGNHNIFDGVVRQGISGKSHNTRITLGYLSENGLDNLPDTSRSAFLDMRSDVRLSPTDQLQFQFGMRQINEEEGLYNDPFTPQRDIKINTHFQQVRWSRNLGTNQAFKLQLFHNYRNNGDKFLTDPIPLGPLGTQRVAVNLEAIENRYDLEFEHTAQPNPAWRLVWGAGTRLDGVRSEGLFGTSDTVENSSYRLFSQIEWRASPRAIVNAGAMAEISDLANATVSPRLALNYHLTQNHTLRVAGSRAARSPVLFEELGNLKIEFFGVNLDQFFLAVGDLDPEIMESIELGYLGRLLQGNIVVDFRLYRDRLRDVVTTILVPAVDSNDNVALSERNEGEVTIDGIDIAVEWHNNHHTYINLSLSSMHATGSILSNDAIAEEQDRLSSVPDYSFGMMATQRFAGTWNLSALYYSVGDMRWQGGEKIKGYGRFDLRLSRKLRFSGKQVTIAITAQNLLDDDYTEFDQQNVYDQRIFATLAMQFR